MTVPLNLVLVFWFLILDFKKAGRKKKPDRSQALMALHNEVIIFGVSSATIDKSFSNFACLSFSDSISNLCFNFIWRISLLNLLNNSFSNCSNSSIASPHNRKRGEPHPQRISRLLRLSDIQLNRLRD